MREFESSHISQPVRSLRRISGLFESARDCRKIKPSRTGFRLCENCRHSRGRLTGFWRDRSSTADVSPGRDIYLRGDGTGSAAAYLSLVTPPETAAGTERVRRGARMNKRVIKR